MAATMQALLLTTANAAATIERVPMPTAGTNELLVRVYAVALNPVDALYVAKPIAAQPTRVVGSDVAGEVVQVPELLREPPDPRHQVGARVAGFLQGACSMNARPGAFAQFVTPEADLVWLLPEAISYEKAAAVSMGAMTSAQGIFFRLGLPSPFWPAHQPAVTGPLTVFVYGASTSLGLYAAQWLHLVGQTAGREVILVGAASRARHGMLREYPYGYETLVDYRDADWAEQVRAATGGRGVEVGVDCISEGKTVAGVDSVLMEGGRYAVFRAPAGGGYSLDGLRVKPIYGAVWEGLGAEVVYYNFTIPKDAKARGLEHVSSDGFNLIGSGIMASTLKVQHARTEEYMKPVSAEKLVYAIE